MTDMETIERLQARNDIQAATIERLQAQLGQARAEKRTAIAERRYMGALLDNLRQRLRGGAKEMAEKAFREFRND